MSRLDTGIAYNRQCQLGNSVPLDRSDYPAVVLRLLQDNTNPADILDSLQLLMWLLCCSHMFL